MRAPWRHLLRNDAKGQVNAPLEQDVDFDAASVLGSYRLVTGRAFIVDEDTLWISREKIRLFGIDALKRNHSYGIKAKWVLHSLCKDQVVSAVICHEDNYGRAVAYCFLPDGTDLSQALVQQGLAPDWQEFSKGYYRRFETPDARRKLFLADVRQKGTCINGGTLRSNRLNNNTTANG
ncbi:thermonuclease family protein [Polycladidibacter hongkongensis]|uniref:thermonuclease family protein n=1 Tax=Polycladidibacter hongkongensis TaxID=1647556 RepID=UPI000A7EC71D|nr:thermonuclease family protein [Pseudovibrio hongkongensis]